MRAVYLFLLWIGLLAIPVVSPAATDIPFRYRHGMIWLQIQTASQARPLNFLLDSGAGASILDLQTARRLGLKLGRQEIVQGIEGSCAARRVRGLAATAATVPVIQPNQNLLALDLRPLRGADLPPIDGLLGLDFFQGRIVQIDYAAQTIRLLTPDESLADTAQVIPIRQRNRALCIAASINGNRPQNLRLDTGCSSALEWVPGHTTTRQAPLISVAAAVGTNSTVATEIRLGTASYPNIKTGLHPRSLFTGESGLLGNGLLAKFRVTIDLTRSELRLSQR